MHVRESHAPASRMLYPQSDKILYPTRHIICHKVICMLETLPESMVKKVNALVTAGYYSNESEIVRDAIISLFETDRELNLKASIELYKKGEISLRKAAEIAGMTSIEFKDVLAKKGFLRTIEARSTEEMDRKLKKYT